MNIKKEFSLLRDSSFPEKESKELIRKIRISNIFLQTLSFFSKKHKQKLKEQKKIISKISNILRKRNKNGNR